MKKPHGRKIKKQVGEILLSKNRANAFKELKKIPNQMLSAPLFSYFYSLDELLRFRSSTAMGELTNRLAENKMEDARIILRRLMWNLNDESGGIGWGSVEAMGEILSLNKTLAKEFESILFSYINSESNFLEHEMLQRGVLWGIGTYIKNCKISDKTIASSILPFIESEDPVKRGYAVRALLHIDGKNINMVPAHIFSDKSTIPFFDGWDLLNVELPTMATI